MSNSVDLQPHPFYSISLMYRAYPNISENAISHYASSQVKTSLVEENPIVLKYSHTHKVYSNCYSCFDF